MVDTKTSKNAAVSELPEGFDITQAEAAVKALVQHSSKKKEDSLFLDAPVRFMIDIRASKVPDGEDHFFNIRLPNTPHSEIIDLDLLLVVPDVKERDPDHVVGEVRDILMSSSHSDKFKVREIMTLQQFRDDYSQFEAKRALAKSVDVVIAENKVWKMIPGILGRDFFKKKKFPISIPGRKLTTADIGEQIWLALHKTVLNLSLKGQNSTVVVGHDTLSVEELTENMKKIIHWLGKEFPGGWSNIEKLSLHTGQPDMPPLPIYFSTGSTTESNLRKRPRTKRDTDTKPVVDEISTQLGKRMMVFSDGHIKVIKAEERDELDDIL